MRKLHKNIVLVGMMGAGKSAIGAALAQRLNVGFVDSDDAIEEAANARVSEIFARDGETFFRAREREVICRLLSGKGQVIATGGGAFVNEETRAAINQSGISVWLDADLDLLWSRVKGRDTRPLLRTDDPYGTLKSLYDARLPCYRHAQIHVRALPELSILEMTDKTVAALDKIDDIWEA